jgi:hypothetical protein
MGTVTPPAESPVSEGGAPAAAGPRVGGQAPQGLEATPLPGGLPPGLEAKPPESPDTHGGPKPAERIVKPPESA